MNTDVVRIDEDGRRLNRFHQEVIDCKWCGGPTTMTGTKMCDGCWELDRRISADPELAERMCREKNERIRQVVGQYVWAAVDGDNVSLDGEFSASELRQIADILETRDEADE